MKIHPPVIHPILRVAVPVPLRRLFDYLPLEAREEMLVLGMRVLVPFGRQQKVGIVVGFSEHSELPREKLKRISAILDPEPLFPPTIFQLIQWSSRYYQGAIGEVFESALPNYLRKKTSASPKTPKKTPKPVIETQDPNTLPPTPPELNTQQQQAIDTLVKYFGQFKTFLLDGVTGSGKTEVYLRVVEQALAQGKQALILVPEIGLTPQLLKRFQERFPVPIAVLNSSLTPKKRFENWEMARTGAAAIVIGTRLAVFVPLLNPGVFILDEEHDSSFKQQEGFRYHARDVMIMRASLEHCPVVLGSATPSLESLHNVTVGKFHSLKLPNRAGQGTFPTLQVLDIRHKKLEGGLSSQLIGQIKEHISNKGQVLLFLNRRGYSPVLMCFECGWVANCQNCDAKMTLHFHSKKLLCHHCEMSLPLPTACPNCNHENPKPVGVGTEKLENVLKEHFPTLNIARIDRDTTRKKGSLQTAFDRVQEGEAEILIGTQMIAKGHHLPQVTLVGILDIDHALFSTDFRSIEKMGQLITQVAGRTGRAERPGHVVLQTCHPEHPLLKKILEEGYQNFAASLLAERHSIHLPPYSHQALIRAESKQPNQALDFLASIKNALQNLSQTKPNVLHISGPIPAPMERRLGKHRAQLLLQSSERTYLQKHLGETLDRFTTHPLSSSVRWSLDVDPIDLY